MSTLGELGDRMIRRTMERIAEDLTAGRSTASETLGAFIEGPLEGVSTIAVDVDLPEGSATLPNPFDKGAATIMYVVSFMPPEVQRIVASYGLASSLFDDALNMEHACSSLSRRAQVPDSHRALWREASEVCRRNEAYSCDPSNNPIPEEFKQVFVSSSRRKTTKGDLYKENNELRKRVDELEKLVESMKAPPASRGVLRKIK